MRGTIGRIREKWSHYLRSSLAGRRRTRGSYQSFKASGRKVNGMHQVSRAVIRNLLTVFLMMMNK